MEKYNENDVESMLEYIEELESQLDEYSSEQYKINRHFMRNGYADANKKEKLYTGSAARATPKKGAGIANLLSQPDADGEKARVSQKRHSELLNKIKEDYDVESMLEYIEELESQLERYDADLDANKNGKLDSDDFKQLRNKKKKSDCNESIESMLESVLSGNLVESKQSFADILGAKIAARLAEAKIAVAQSLFGVVESKDEDEDDQKSAETSDEDFNKHPLSQLQKIADYKPNTREEDLEYNADGSADKRSLRALEDRKKKSGSTSGKPTFKHKNGEESDIHPEHAQHLVNVLKGSAVKPDTKKAVLDTIHGSKAGLDKVKSALGTGVVKNKSIYSDARE